MTESYELFGHRLIEHHQMTFEEQIRDVLVEEIHAGRWQVGDRLPGILALAKEGGFGTKTMQKAFEKLKAEGYIESRGNRGTYLKAVSPSRNASGRIGILFSEEQRDVQLVLWYQHIILSAAEERGYLTEVKVIPDGTDPRRALTPGALFSPEVVGIISLMPFESLLPFDEAGIRLPHVFLCPPFEVCAPKVTADVEYAYYELTHRMIDAGHEQVAFSYDTVELDRRQAEMHLAGYRRAMAERGLPVDEELIEISKPLANKEDVVGVTDYLRRLVAMSPERRPTALVCGSLGRTTVLTTVAPLCGVEIPEQLSVGSIGTAPVRGQKNVLMTGMLPDFDKMMESCFSMLHEYRTKGSVSRICTTMKLNFVPGDTLCARNGAAPAKPVHSGLQTRYAVEPLSEAVHY